MPSRFCCLKVGLSKSKLTPMLTKLKTPMLTKLKRFYHCCLWENDIWNISAQSFKTFTKFTGNILNTMRMLQADIKQNLPNRFGDITLKAPYM